MRPYAPRKCSSRRHRTFHFASWKNRAVVISVDGLILFAAASAVLAIAPGPDNIFVLTHSALHGYRAGLCVTAGLCTGLLGHIAAVALGVSALLQTSAFAFVVLKIVGAGYLLY